MKGVLQYTIDSASRKDGTFMYKQFFSLLAALALCLAALPGNMSGGGINGNLPPDLPAIVDVGPPTTQVEPDEPDQPSPMAEQEPSYEHDSTDD